MNPSSLFSLSDHLAKLSKDGDRLEVLEATVDFEYFRTWLVECFVTLNNFGVKTRKSRTRSCMI